MGPLFWFWKISPKRQVDSYRPLSQIGLEMTEPRSFLLRYVGARFEGHRLPLDVLPDLSAFRDLLVSYVKADWHAAHTDRERLPKGFEKSIAFDLVSIRDGSAVPQLDWDRETTQLLLPDFKDELEGLVEASYLKVLRLIDGANSAAGTVELTFESIRALNRFGSGLLPDERIEFLESRGSDGKVVYLDTIRRKRLITRGRDSYQKRFEDLGKLLGSEIDPMATVGTISILTADYGKIDIPVSPERVRDDFDGNIEADVQFRLMIELGRDDGFRRVIEVFDVDVIDAKVVANLAACRDRIASLVSMRDGWHDGSGKSPTYEAAAAATRLLARKPSMAASYRIFPTVLNQEPFLERRSTANTADGAAGNAWANAWQQIAPSIEDLQVQYWSFGLGVPAPSAANPVLLNAPGNLLIAGLLPTQAEMIEAITALSESGDPEAKELIAKAVANSGRLELDSKKADELVARAREKGLL